MIEKVLVVDDEPLMLRFVSDVVKRMGKEVLLAQDGMEAVYLLKNESVDLVISDMKMPKKGGFEVLQAALSLPSPPIVILATAHGTIESAVDAMKQGAFHYIIKPFSPEALENLIQKVEDHLKLLREHQFYKQNVKYPQFVTQNPQMQKILQSLKKIAKANASVFITGESGTGKEVISSWIHQMSSRKSHPFIKVNCAAIPEALLESEFFGHEKGAFTGAHMRKIGRFELADLGTLLLDEVTEIPLNLQPKLLRAIQEQEFERVGATKPTKVNLRFLATSNRNMQEAIETKVFREDLYYRLNVVPIHIPPLRERREDIVYLANHFLEKFCIENHKPIKKLTSQAEKKLLDYPWPGNVRELANIIERTVVLDFDEVIDQEHLYLDSSVFSTKPEIKTGLTLHQMEKELILHTLKANHQNRTKTADQLGISVRTLRNKIQEYNDTCAQD